MSTRTHASAVEVHDLDTSSDFWADVAFDAWLDAARTAGTDAERCSTVPVRPDGRSCGWAIVDGRLWLVTVSPQSPGRSNVYATRPGPMAYQVARDERGRYDYRTDGYPEEWRDVHMTATDEGASIRTLEVISGGWPPFTTVEEIRYPDGEVAYWLVEASNPTLNETIAAHEAR
jgi:hypothetical protein